jgi:hypothetical protein
MFNSSVPVLSNKLKLLSFLPPLLSTPPPPPPPTNILFFSCDECGGKGKKVTSTCPHCGGKKVEVTEENLMVSIERGMMDGEKIVCFLPHFPLSPSSFILIFLYFVFYFLLIFYLWVPA